MKRMLRLFRFEQTSGLLMLAAIALALFTANSPFASAYRAIHHAPIHFRAGSAILEGPLAFWINEGLMVFFFLLMGLEIKRQFAEGHLSGNKQAALPAIAAFGGMVVPALIYLAFNASDPSAMRGWAIPTATDIVLALGILSLLGDRVPTGLRVFLAALAIFDDIGAVIVVAVFYRSEFDLPFVLPGAKVDEVVVQREPLVNQRSVLCRLREAKDSIPEPDECPFARSGVPDRLVAQNRRFQLRTPAL